MLINLSNHPSSLWSKEQYSTAIDKFGSVIDLEFPVIDPEGDEDYIERMTDEFYFKIKDLRKEEETITVHIMGEQTFCHALINKLTRIGIPCVASTTKRKVKIVENQKVSEFQFVRFRYYQNFKN